MLLNIAELWYQICILFIGQVNTYPRHSVYCSYMVHVYCISFLHILHLYLYHFIIVPRVRNKHIIIIYSCWFDSYLILYYIILSYLISSEFNTVQARGQAAVDAIQTYEEVASNLATSVDMASQAEATINQVRGKHDGVIKWKHFPRYWPFVRGIHWSPVNSLHKGQWHGAFVFSLNCAWINRWVNNTREAGDSRRYPAHYDVIVMATWDPFY